MSTRKPNANCKLLSLTEAQQAELADLLLGGMPYHKAQAFVESEWGVRVAISAFTPFWDRYCAPAFLARRAKAVGLADEVAQVAEARPGRFDEATVAALKQLAFEMSVSPTADPKAVKAYFTLLLKYRDQDLEERRVALLEKKAAQADQAKDVVASALSPEEKQLKIRQIFGM